MNGTHRVRATSTARATSSTAGIRPAWDGEQLRSHLLVIVSGSVRATKDEIRRRGVRNVARYKFALGRALLELATKQQTFVPLQDLALIFHPG